MIVEDALEKTRIKLIVSIYDHLGDGAGEYGMAKWGDLLIRYWWDHVDIAWSPTFDKWGNSVDWQFDVPSSTDELWRLLRAAQALGERGAIPTKGSDWQTRGTHCHTHKMMKNAHGLRCTRCCNERN